MKNYSELIPLIEKWADDRGLIPGDPKKQYLKFLEEVGETARAILKNNKPEIIDGFGDIAVTIVILAKQHKTTLNSFENLKKLHFGYLFLYVQNGLIGGNSLDILSGVALNYGYNLLECLNSAYEVIKNREGKTINGTFIKSDKC